MYIEYLSKIQVAIKNEKILNKERLYLCHLLYFSISLSFFVERNN